MNIRIQNKQLGDINITFEGIDQGLIRLLSNLSMLSDIPSMITKVFREKEQDMFGTRIEEMINKILEEREIKRAQDNLIQMPELLEMLKPLGYTRSTVDKWIMKAKRNLSTFPFTKKGRRLVFDRTKIENWLRSN